MSNKDRIPVMQPRMPQYKDVKSFLKAMDASGTYSNNGPLVRSLENKYAEKLNINPLHIVAVANATLAIEGFLSISPVEEWVIPSYTFSATGLAALNSGKRIVLADANVEDWQIDLSQHLDPLSRGIVPVMPFGAKVDLQKYIGFQNVLIDAAASIAEFPDLSSLKSGWAVVYSLHATKLLGAGEGGLIIFGSTELAQRFRQWINFGFFGMRESNSQGTNAKMSEIHAAYAHASLRNWRVDSSNWSRAQAQAKNTSAKFGEHFHHWQPGVLNPYWIVHFDDPKDMERLERHLEHEGISTRRWWSKPLHEMLAFREIEAVGKLEISSKLANSVLGLPMYRDLSTNDSRRIEKVMLKFFTSH
jgi:dTDP-4-amino-4,6-dideoxygalactose transaminase